ncbi:MAG: prepilin-type N-terminal cleavage/methylation domain-containing protein [Armatimonadetes bacterium]|nr:prepilin-type N-terminal cleavage/methylation domain-containing protein [Armatimonadota bacterium]
MKRRPAFSLIELLVVIGIIAILAAILFPMLLNVRVKARQIQCVANLKQIGTATALYLNDNNGRFPLWNFGDPMSGWYGAAVAYSRSKVLAQCPGVKKKSSKPSYWRNVYTDLWSPQSGVAPAASSDMIYQKSTVYLMCGPDVDNGIHTYWGPPTTWGGVPKADEEEAERRHNGGANVLFVDSHVSLVMKGGFISNSAADAASDPLKNNAGANTYGHPTAPWDKRNDGSHPWFRSN